MADWERSAWQSGMRSCELRVMRRGNRIWRHVELIKFLRLLKDQKVQRKLRADEVELNLEVLMDRRFVIEWRQWSGRGVEIVNRRFVNEICADKTGRKSWSWMKLKHKQVELIMGLCMLRNWLERLSIWPKGSKTNQCRPPRLRNIFKLILGWQNTQQNVLEVTQSSQRISKRLWMIICEDDASLQMDGTKQEAENLK